MTSNNSLVQAARIESRILLIRDQRVLIDADLAELYGVTTKRLNEQVKRNKDRSRPTSCSPSRQMRRPR